MGINPQFFKMERNEAEQGFKSLGTETRRVTFPLLFWEEFEKDCIENYNNTYYLKIQADHEYRKSMQSITQLIIQDLANMQIEIAGLKEEIQELRDSGQESKEQMPQTKKLKRFGSE